MARDSGVNEFLTKLFSVQTLFRRIVEVVNKPQPYIRTGEYFGPDRRRRQDAKYKGPEWRQYSRRRGRARDDEEDEQDEEGDEAAETES